MLKRWVKRGVITLAVAGAGFVMVTAWYVGRAAPVCTGYTAKYLCSSTFIAGQDPRRAYIEDVAPVNLLSGFVRWRIDRRRMAATAELLGLFKATALYRRGCGCTLLVGVSEAELRRQSFFRIPQEVSPSGGRSLQPWPLGRGEPENPADLGVDRAMLEAALDRAFAEPAAPEQTRRTRAVLVVYRGHMIAERYAPALRRTCLFSAGPWPKA